MCAYLILGLGALCMTQVNWASSPATNTAFLILFTKRGGTTGNMLKYNSCLNTLEVSHENTTYVGLFSKNMAKVQLTHYWHFHCSIIIKTKAFRYFKKLSHYVTYPERWSCRECWHCRLSLWQSTCTVQNHLLSCYQESVCRNHRGPRWWCDEDRPPQHVHLHPTRKPMQHIWVQVLFVYCFKSMCLYSP